MRELKTNKLERKDWLVITVLLIAFTLLVLNEIVAFQLLGTYKDLDSGLADLKNFGLFSIIGVLLITVFSIFYFAKAAAQRNKAKLSKAVKQEELEQNLSIIKDLYDNAPIGFHSTNAQDIIIEMNQTELDWIGYTKEEVVHKMKLTDLMLPKTAAEEAQLSQQLKASGKLENIEGMLRRKDGTHMKTMASSRAVFDEQGRIKQVRVAVMDFTERKKLELELENAKEEAEYSAMLKEQFVANMSHEIRTPLNAILGFSHLLQRTKLTERQTEFANNINSSSESLSKIVEDILDFSKIEAGVLQIDTVRFSPAQLVHAVENIFRINAEAKGLDFEIRLDKKVPEHVMGDPNRLTQILSNLLSNAFKFTLEGKVILSVFTLSSNDEKVILCFKVKDTGIGIAPHKLETIFQRFGQASPDTTRRFGGSGLGLTISKQLIEMQGGEIDVESIEGEGTTFTINLPCEIARKTAVEQTTGTPNANIFAQKELHVLLVEDNPLNHRIMELLFESWGNNPDHAENGAKAIELLQEKKYDLILLDIQMPLMDGYTTAHIIRKELKLDVPIIGVTAHASEGEKEKCLSFGMNDNLSKAVREDDLLALILNYLPQNLGTVKTTEHEAIKKKVEEQFDRKYVMAITKGKSELLIELSNLVIEQSALEMQEIDAGLKANNFEQIGRSAHSMRSTALSMGFNKLMGETLKNIEQEASQSSPEKSKVLDLFKTLQILRKEAISFLEREFLNN